MPPTVHTKAIGKALNNPDIMVLGDSFTAPNLGSVEFGRPE
jgi:hypothetical protein